MRMRAQLSSSALEENDGLGQKSNKLGRILGPFVGTGKMNHIAKNKYIKIIKNCLKIV